MHDISSGGKVTYLCPGGSARCVAKVTQVTMKVNSKVARRFLQAAVKFRPVFLVNRDCRIPLDRS